MLAKLRNHQDQFSRQPVGAWLTTYSVFFCFLIFEGDSWQKSFELDQQLYRIKPKMTPDFIAQLHILPDILAV